jgi:hypothetical protein
VREREKGERAEGDRQTERDKERERWREKERENENRLRALRGFEARNFEERERKKVGRTLEGSD